MPNGLGNLVLSDGSIIEGAHKSKKIRKRTSTRSKTTTPPPPKIFEPQVEPIIIVLNSVSKLKGDGWTKSP